MSWISRSTLDESVLSTQLQNTNKRLTQVQAERRRLIDAFQGGFITKQEFQERSRTVAARITELHDDLKGLHMQRTAASEGNDMVSRVSSFTSLITHKLDEMTFHERQALAR